MAIFTAHICPKCGELLPFGAQQVYGEYIDDEIFVIPLKVGRKWKTCAGTAYAGRALIKYTTKQPVWSWSSPIKQHFLTDITAAIGRNIDAARFDRVMNVMREAFEAGEVYGTE